MIKIVLFIATLLASAISLACPNLTGNYTCDVGGEVSIGYTVMDGIFEFNINDEYFFVDSNTNPIENDKRSGTYVSYCSEDSHSLHINQNFVYKDNIDEPPIDYRQEFYFANDQLKIKSSWHQTIFYTSSCRKI